MGDGRIFIKSRRYTSFNKDLSIEPYFNRIHLAGQYLELHICIAVPCTALFSEPFTFCWGFKIIVFHSTQKMVQAGSVCHTNKQIRKMHEFFDNNV